jgi:glutathione S-transferase
MKVLDAFGPNPRKLRMYLHEKGLTLAYVPVDVMGGENRRPPFTDKNPGGQVPALELDDGRVIGETVPIFEYLEERHPAPPLIGASAEERAEARMWTRRIEQRITENIYNGFRFGDWPDFFKDRMPVIPEAAPGLKAAVRDNLRWLDPLLAGKRWIVGDRFTIADIVLYCALDFGASAGQPVPDGLSNVIAWKERVDARPSASASLHPEARKLNMPG